MCSSDLTEAEHIGFTITPQMREAYKKPIPYRKGGEVDKPTIDQMKLALMRK